MKIEIISVGNEILSGNILDTNFNFISFELSKIGYAVFSHKTISDDLDILKKEIKRSFEENDLIIISGGLGPTEDDRTKEAVSSLFKMPLKLDLKLKEDFERRFKINKYIESQAFVPKGAIILKNEIGTAPGFIFESNKKSLILLPGMPDEMKKMFFSYVIDYVKKKFPLKEKIYQKDVCLCIISENEVEPFLEVLRKKNNQIEIGIYPSYSSIRVNFKGKNLEKINSFVKSLKDRYKYFVLECKTIEENIKKLLVEENKKLALAESCSGGYLSSSLTFLPETSRYFLGSIVTYSNELKKDILKVPEEILKTKGAVSEEVVEAMVKGVFGITKADYAVAISGIAGPGGATDKKPVGMVCIGVGKRGEKVDKKTIYLQGDRSFIIKLCSKYALGLLYLKIKYPSNISKIFEGL